MRVAVATMNFGDARRTALAELAELADVVGTQEGGDRDRDIAAFLTAHPGWAMFGADLDRQRGKTPILHNGTRLEVADSGWVPMDDGQGPGKPGAGGGERKWLLWQQYADRATGGATFTVANTHATPSLRYPNRRRHHAEHMRRIAVWARTVHGPLVVTMDANAAWGHDHLDPLRTAGFRLANPPGDTHPSTGRRIDLILARGATPAGGQVLDTPSDHHAVVATLDIPVTTPKPEPVPAPEPTPEAPVGYYLLDHPPRIRQFRDRGTTPSGVVVVHTAESTPDWIGHDSGAEAVARFIQGRTTYGSYHSLCDSDSAVKLVPPWMQAYGDGTGSNPHAWHVSAATQAAKWMQATKAWRDATVRQMAREAAWYARWLKAEHGITIPARRITRAQSDKRVPGFISHGERDPGRRTDPGPDFPWTAFLDYYAAELGGEGDSDMPLSDEDLDKIAYKVWAKEIGGGDNRKPARLHVLQAANASLRNEANAIDPRALAAAVVAALPAGDVDEETVVRGVKRALRELIADGDE